MEIDMHRESHSCDLYAELFHRHADNPILTARDWPYPANTVFNAGTCQMGEETVLLVRVEDRRGHSHLTVARSNDGVSHWRIDSKPSFAARSGKLPGRRVGRGRPPRDLDGGPRPVDHRLHGLLAQRPAGVAGRNERLHLVSRLGPVMPPEDKDAANFPRRFGNRYAMIHRPVSSGQFGAHIWLSFSPDLNHWGGHQHPLARAARRVVGRQQDRIGPAAPGNGRGLVDPLRRRAYDGRRLFVSTRVWPCWTWRTLAGFFVAATNGSSPPRCPTSARATWTASCFPAAGFGTSPAARFVFITAGRTRAWPWPRPNSPTCSATCVRVRNRKRGECGTRRMKDALQHGSQFRRCIDEHRSTRTRMTGDQMVIPP